MKQFRNYIAICLTLIIVVSCKKEATSKDGEPIESPIQVVVDMRIKKNDSFQLFYTESKDMDFDEARSVWVEVLGKNESQVITFDLPEDVKIGNLRFDGGTNPEQEEMIINKFIIKQHDQEMEINGAEFFTYFDPNEVHVKTSPEKSSFKGITVNGIYDPAFYGNKSLVQALSEF